MLDDPAGVAWRSISELARSCGTSATSVVRFCRAIGLRGYPELRLALAGAVAHDDAASVVAASSDIDPDDDPVTITKKIAYADAAAVTETASRLDVGALVKVVDALAVANRIDIYGVGASGLVAVDLQIKLQRIARPAFAWPDPHLAATSAALRDQGDVAVGLSHTGTTVDTIDALTEARAHGATTVAITNFPWSPITEVADFVLLTAARETAFRSGAMTSRIAQLTVVDCLFVTLAQRDLPAPWTRWSGRSRPHRQARPPRAAPKPLSGTGAADPWVSSALDPADQAGAVDLPLRGDEQQHDRQLRRSRRPRPAASTAPRWSRRRCRSPCHRASYGSASSTTGPMMSFHTPSIAYRNAISSAGRVSGTITRPR